MSDILKLDSTWLVVVPTAKLTVSDDAPINGEWRVGDIVFRSRKATEQYLEAKGIKPGGNSQKIALGEYEAFAITERSGILEDLRKTVYFDLLQAAQIIAATDSFYGLRHLNHGFTLQGYPIHTRKYYAFVDLVGRMMHSSNNIRGMLFPFELNAEWHTAVEQTGLMSLFDRITDKTLDKDWRRQITSAAAILGKSLMSLQLHDAFLLNVIGLETLLTRKGERNGKALTKRIKGLTGWHLQRFRPSYEQEIKDVHEIRCAIVHDSDYSGLTTEILLLADLYLKNCLLNVVRNPEQFPNKDELARISDRYADSESWPTGANLRWIGNSTFAQKDLDLPLW